jgi:hypothetical protein
METGLFEIQAEQVHEFRQTRQLDPDQRKIVYARSEAVLKSTSKLLVPGLTSPLFPVGQFARLHKLDWLVV